MSAYYNEIDEYAAEWLRALIKAGHIADGVVDTRSISEIEPNDIREFTQCHFFAGIGVWSHALRLAGWPDERRVWTGSCPCQPFSAAGRAGGFADERHLWPHWHHLIRECCPDVVFGEQVASKDGLGWLDLVHADLEGEGYAVGAVDLCAAGVGAPHIRQRLWFVADANGAGCERKQASRIHERRLGAFGAESSPGGIDWTSRHDPYRRCEPGELADAEQLGHRSEIEAPNLGQSEANGPTDIDSGHRRACDQHGPTGPTNNHWRAADWLLCRDAKWRPVEPGTFPLAHGAPARVGRLRAYGNAIVAQVAAEVIGAYMDVAQ